MTCLPNWTAPYPVLYLESSSRTTHPGFWNEGADNESVPYRKVQGRGHSHELMVQAPDSNPDGRAQEAQPNGLEVEDLCFAEC